jgi:hypothetical protein
VTEFIRKRGDRRVQLTGLERRLGPARVRVGDEVELVGQRIWTEPTPLGSLLVQEGVAQGAQEVAEVVLVAE